MDKLPLKVPFGYSTCSLADCPVADHCLRQRAYRQLVETERTLHVLNPRFYQPGEQCPHRCDDKPVTYARGFTRLQRELLPRQYDHIKWVLMGHFSRSGFFRRRNGEQAMSPQEQALVKRALREAGVTADMAFDAYEERLEWKH